MHKLADRSVLPMTLTAGLAVAMSVLAYAGHVPSVLAAHGIDKVLHLAMSFILALALGRALGGRVVLAAVTVFAVLALDEYLQRFSAHRSSDWGDLTADFVGCALAIVLPTTERLR